MSEYNRLNIKFSNSQHNKLNTGIKNGAEVTVSMTISKKKQIKIMSFK